MTLHMITRYRALGFLFCVCFLIARSFAEEDSPEPAGSSEGTVGTANVMQFGAMIFCATGRNPLDYNGYGCYCGFGGGGKAVDAVDSCCEVHDNCYGDAIKESGCPSWYPYVASYNAVCVACLPSWSYGFHPLRECKHAICKCDSAAAKCFAGNTYNKSYKDYDKKKNC
ncbi:acidic phospholipase A2 PA-3-like [Ptychodera flava]|uniref:acidic phospholipase A2 PA-3-like n=1 Tax=Ptychodera flava TaxID=63121 RepID=UPI003969D8F2